MEETYKVTVHLINGKKLRCMALVSASDLNVLYRVLGNATGRIKFPTRKNKQQFLPASSVLRIEAKGRFE